MEAEYQQLAQALKQLFGKANALQTLEDFIHPGNYCHRYSCTQCGEGYLQQRG